MQEDEKILLSYKNTHLERECTKIDIAQKKLGSLISVSLIALINYLTQADNLKDVYAAKQYHLHGLTGNRAGQYALDINGRKSSYRLLFVPNQKDLSKDKSNLMYFYEQITSITIQEVSKHYE